MSIEPKAGHVAPDRRGESWTAGERLARRFMTSPAIQGLAGRIERAFLPAAPDEDPAPIFIVGAPRSGTTLLTQALTRGLALGYPDNFCALLPGAPALAARARRWLLGRGAHDEFRSRHGETRSWRSPHEFGEFFYRWFPRDAVVAPEGSLERGAIESLRRAVASMSRELGAPVLFKNVYNSVRIGSLREAFPAARFIVCRRDAVACAGSILRTRRAVLGDDRAWWSLRPPGHETLGDLSPVEQVVGQVLLLERHVDRDLEDVPGDQVRRVTYEGFCESPRETVEDLRRWLETTGTPVECRGEVPGCFEATGPGDLEASEIEALETAVHRFTTLTESV